MYHNERVHREPRLKGELNEKPKGDEATLRLLIEEKYYT